MALKEKEVKEKTAAVAELKKLIDDASKQGPVVGMSCRVSLTGDGRDAPRCSRHAQPADGARAQNASDQARGVLLNAEDNSERYARSCCAQGHKHQANLGKLGVNVFNVWNRT